MPLKKLDKITQAQIAQNGVQSLSNRPNMANQYGESGLSANQLKLRFDKFATFLAQKINLIIDSISSESAAEYISIALQGYNVNCLDDLIKSFISGDFADKILKLAPSASQQEKQTLQSIINSIAQELAKIKERLGGIDSFNDELLKTLDKHNDNITKNKDDIVVLDSKIQSHGDRIFRIEEGIAGGFGFEFNQLKDSMEKQDEKLSARINENAENIEMLKAFAVEKNDLVVSEIKDSYDVRVTAAGGNVADNSRSTLKKVEGNTVSCHNLVNIGAMENLSTNEGILYGGVSVDFVNKTVTNGGAKNNRFVFYSYEALCKFFNIKGAGKYRLSYKTTGAMWKWRLVSGGSLSITMPFNGTFEITQDDIDILKALWTGGNISFYMDGAVGDIISDIQIVEGEEEKPYVPYFAGLKNASFKGITSTGRNLISNPSQHISVANGYYDEVITNVKLLPNTTYCLSFDYKINSSTDEKPTCDVGYGDTIMRVSLTPSGVPLGSTSGHFSTTFTTPQTFQKVSTQNPKFVARYVRIGTQGNLDAEVSNIQLTFGDTEQDFAPYEEDTIELPTAVESGLGTTIDLENRKIINRGKEIVFDGTETIYHKDYGNGYYVLYWYNKLDGIAESRAKYVSTDAAQLNGEWTDGAVWVGVNDANLYWVNAVEYLGVYPGTDIGQMKANFAAYLKQRYESGNPVKIRYVASTGTETELDNNATYMTRKDGMETVLGNENREYVNNTLTQEYFEYAGGEEV